MLRKNSLLLIIVALTGLNSFAQQPQKKPANLVDYVNPLMGSDSKYDLSNGNTYPAVALPWGMNFGRRKPAKWAMVGNTLMMLIK